MHKRKIPGNHKIMNTTNIKRGNITVDAVVETWKKEFSDGRDNDIINHVWRYVLGDWSKVRQNKFLMAGLRAVCIAVLTWGFLESVLTSFSISGIWIWTAFRQKTFIMKWNSFVRVNPQHLQVIFNVYGLLRLRLENLYFTLKVSVKCCLNLLDYCLYFHSTNIWMLQRLLERSKWFRTKRTPCARLNVFVSLMSIAQSILWCLECKDSCCRFWSGGYLLGC